MARGSGTVVVKFLGDITDLQKKTSDAEGVLGKVGSAVGGAAKTLATVGVPALAGFGVAALKAFGDSEKVGSQTAAVLKSTAGAAHVTAAQVGNLATSLSKMSGVDDETIQSGENLLLTFTNIQNKAGKGNDIFNQATGTILDMSTALGQDLNSSAIQLGKALNDPTKGITALQRVGVSFTDAQKKQIDSMVKAGDTAGAQKVILQELQKEFGGSAKAAGDTFAGSMDKLKVQAENFMEGVGGKLAPFVTGLANAFGDGGASGAIKYLVTQFQNAWPSIQAALGNMMTAIGAWITGTAVPYLQAQFPVWAQAFWQWIQDVTPPALQKLGQFLEAVGKWILNPGLPMLASALAELGKALWHWIQDNAPGALEKLGELLEKLGAWILTTGIPKLVGWLANMGVKLLDWIADVFPQLPGKLGEFMGKITAWIVTTGIPKLVEGVGKLSEKLIGWIADLVPQVPGKMADFIGAIAGWMKDKGPGILKDGIDILGGAITAPFKFAFNTIAGFWNNTVGKISFSVPSWVPGLGGKGFDFPKIPLLAQGGIVTSPTLAVLGEAGPEAVVPLNRGGMGNVYNITITGAVDKAGAAREIEKVLYEYTQAGGTLRFVS